MSHSWLLSALFVLVFTSCSTGKLNTSFTVQVIHYFSNTQVVLQTLSGCTIHMVTPPLREECCKSAGQIPGEQCVIIALAVLKREELLVDNWGLVAAT